MVIGIYVEEMFRQILTFQTVYSKPTGTKEYPYYWSTQILSKDFHDLNILKKHSGYYTYHLL